MTLIPSINDKRRKELVEAGVLPKHIILRAKTEVQHIFNINETHKARFRDEALNSIERERDIVVGPNSYYLEHSGRWEYKTLFNGIIGSVLLYLMLSCVLLIICLAIFKPTNIYPWIITFSIPAIVIGVFTAVRNERRNIENLVYKAYVDGAINESSNQYATAYKNAIDNTTTLK